MGKRPGVTILEVLSAAMIIIIALVGISATATAILKKSRTPSLSEQAALLANERLAYFRSQPDPYRAVGGTHYLYKAGDPQDYNQSTACNNNYNGRPFPFVREYLYSTNEGQMMGAGNVDTGRTNLRQRTLTGGGAGGLNQIPSATDPMNLSRVLVRVLANQTGWPDVVAPATAPTVPDATVQYFLAAPRANAALPPAINNAFPPSVRFVREVWVQTNHAAFTAPAPPAVPFPPAFFNPNVLPAYTVAVTVRVFERKTNMPIYTVARPGYERDKPLATVTGYFSLKRNLN